MIILYTCSSFTIVTYMYIVHVPLPFVLYLYDVYSTLYK